jgi:putative endonuclease
MASTGWFCYLLECADGTLYAGITTAVDRRLTAHNLGSASKYTRARRPVRLVHTEPWPDRSSATRRELALKKLSRRAKLALVRAARKSRTRSRDPVYRALTGR